MKKIWLGAFLTTCLMLPSVAVHAADSATSSQDRKFLRDASQDAMAVEQMSQIASQETENPGVKQITEKVARDYTGASEKMRGLEKNLAVAAPAELDKHSAREIDKLEGLSGAEFDQAVLRELVKSQQACLLKIQQEAAIGSNAKVKEFASATLPPLQDDIYQVVLLQSDMNVTASTFNGNSANAGRPLAAQP
ncbi:MAG TPA: DUF4142 domain-containing protein [Verrucomicrobiae bacterium]|jgi:putative membrane protein|nr:DUF4142 domain-containing protein [Verrucomicrobiae bacterium]